NGFDIVQDVYPVAFARSGQIVYKIMIVNHAALTLTGPFETQYLLDAAVAGNDRPQIMTSWDSITPLPRIWLALDDPCTKTMHKPRPPPQWFKITQLDSGSIGYPGHVAVGYLGEALTPADTALSRPDRFAVGD